MPDGLVRNQRRGTGNRRQGKGNLLRHWHHWAEPPYRVLVCYVFLAVAEPSPGCEVALAALDAT